MKTKIKRLSFLALPVIIIIMATSTFADFGSSISNGNCVNKYADGTSCVTFHNNGYTGADMSKSTDDLDYPYGLDFASFNGYRDQFTPDRRQFDERQFLYIESERADEINIPLPTPWSGESQYDFNQGTSYTINFEDNEPQRIGLWGYMHNNGEAYIPGVDDGHPAFNTNIRLTRWNSETPKNQYNPRFHIRAGNAKPKDVWADVEINGSQPFTLEPREFYVIREKDFDRKEEELIPLNDPEQIQSVTSTSGFGINSNPNYFDPNNPIYRFDSSEKHLVKVYFEFEAIPEEEKEEPVCRSLEIVEPEDFFLGINDIIDLPTGGPFPMLMRDQLVLFIKTKFLDSGEGFINEPLVIVVDADEGAISDFQYVSSDGDITFNENQSPYRTENQNVLMNGDAGDNKVEKISVKAMRQDHPDEYWRECTDTFQIIERTEKGPECANLETSPGSAGPSVIEVNTGPHQIEITELIDTEGNEYLVNGAPPTITYCSTNGESTDFYPSGHEIDISCVSASADVEFKVIAYEPTGIIIEVEGAEEVCNDTFRARKTPDAEEECLLLEIDQTDFNSVRSSYSVTVSTDPEDADYRVEWTVEDQNGNPYNNFPVILEGNEIDLDDYGYTFTPGDTLRARVIDLDYDGDICEDIRTTIPEECNEFELDVDTFERGRDQEICVTRTDWPFFSEVYYETSDRKEGEFQVTEDCFLLSSEIVEEANWIDIWVPEWKERCIWKLKREVRPPDFDKNVKTQDGATFSNRAVASFSDKFANYEITYEHKNDSAQYVTIYDTIGRVGYIQGYIADKVEDIDANTPEGGEIYYRQNSMRVTVAGENIEQCGDPSADLCYEGSIGNSAGVTIYNVPERTEVKIFYDGEIRGSEVTPENCSDPEHIFNQLRPPICGEIYPNIAEFVDELDFEGESQAEVLIPCPYIIIRAGGDVFFENPFDFGADTLYCADIANVDVPIIVGEEPDDREVSETGTDDAIPSFDHRLCNPERDGDDPIPGYEGIEGISSLICEVSLETASQLSAPAIVQNIENNRQKIARYGANLGTSDVRITGQDDIDLSERDNVYVLKNANLTFDNEFANVEFDSGTHTFIVENGNVYINSNIVYRDSEVTDPRNIASLAIIVLNGNIIVDNDVTETSGVLFVQGTDKNTGMICAEPAEDDELCEFESLTPNYSKEQFVHYGSIYGDIAHLFKHRTYVGDPGKEEGAVVIRFDNRIFMNTPAVLNELVDVTQYVF